MITKKALRDTLNYYERIQSDMRDQLETLPDGSLFHKPQHGRFRPYLWTNGKEIYLSSKDKSLIQDLTTRGKIQKSLPALEENISALKQLGNRYTDIDELPVFRPAEQEPEQVIEQTGSRPAPFYPEKVIELGSAPLSENAFRTLEREWKKCHDGGYDYRPEGKRHTTSDLVRVRSRVELIIYEYLKNAGVAFVYESAIRLGNAVFYPDFKLLRPADRRIVLWNHNGMMDDVEYSIDAKNTIYTFANHGFWPMDNLILTYDFGDDSIDVSRLPKILDSMGLRS